MNALYKLWEKFAKRKKYRDLFVAAGQTKQLIPMQIRVLRKQRDWSQTTLAQESNLTQGAISRAEDPDYGNLTINTLVRVAAGFDVAFVGKFVPFSELGRWFTELSEEGLEVASFGDEVNPALDFDLQPPTGRSLDRAATRSLQVHWMANRPKKPMSVADPDDSLILIAA